MIDFLGKSKKNSEEIEALKGENNTLKFRVKEMELSIENLKKQLEEVRPLIKSQQGTIDELRGYITKYHIDVTSDPKKMEAHEKITKGKTTKKSHSKAREVDKE